MQALTKFKAAIFDLDGVITHTATHHYQAWKKLADNLGVPFGISENEKLKGVDRMTSLELILSSGDFNFTDAQKQEMAQEKNRYYLQLIKTLNPADTLPGVLDLLDYLKNNDIKIGLASASKNAQVILDALDLSDRFEYIANPALARSKPASDIFLFASYGLGVRPEACIGFEDSIAGLQALQAASMYAVSVGDVALSPYSDAHLNSLEECLPNI